MNPDFRNDRSLRNTALQRSPCSAGQRVYISFLAKGITVISDSTDSTIVYQGLAGGKPEIIEMINMWAAGRLLPEITFLLDIDVETGLRRLRGKYTGAPDWRGDRMEQKELEFHRKVRQGFLQLASRDSERFFVIQAGDRPESVHEKIWEKMQEILRDPAKG